MAFNIRKFLPYDLKLLAMGYRRKFKPIFPSHGTNPTVNLLRPMYKLQTFIRPCNDSTLKFPVYFVSRLLDFSLKVKVFRMHFFAVNQK